MLKALVEDKKLEPGFYLSPGFYMLYWRNHIAAKYAEEIIMSNTKFQKYREMFIGAVFAASQTANTGINHFVGVSEDEPPDIDVVRFVETKTKKGTPATKRQVFQIEITRCDLSKESLLNQIQAKNKPAYSEMFLVVHLYGNKPAEFNKVFKVLKKEKIYLREIYAVGPINRSPSILLPPGTYGLSRLYPDRGHSIVNLDNKKAFFFDPPAVRKTRLATGTEWEDLGKIRLLAPNL